MTFGKMLRVFTSIVFAALLSSCVTPRSEAPRMIGSSDPKWAPYAEYLQRAIARVQKHWERELVDSRVPPPVGATVTVVFWVSSEGKVSRIEDVKAEPEGVGAKACVSAITRAGTFGPWTAEMKTLLSSEEKMTFTFHYEK